MSELTLRPAPCISCPYRLDVPSGVWAAEEYDKLPDYDGETFEQPVAVFTCHQKDDTVCAGWLGFRDPYDLIALRIAISTGHVPPEVFDYRTRVPLFPSGAAASEHGKRDIDNPGPEARRLIEKMG